MFFIVAKKGLPFSNYFWYDPIPDLLHAQEYGCVELLVYDEAC